MRRPIPAVISVVLRDNSVLLVRRSNPPDAGCWGFPGGKIDFGESIEQAAIRELREETGVTSSAGPVFTAIDAFHRDARGLHEHYLLIAVLCSWTSGEPIAGDDALDARWFEVNNLAGPELQMSQSVPEVARQAAALSRSVICKA